MTTVGLCSTSDIITFDHDWDHLYLSSLLSVLQEEKICPVIPRSESEILETKFPATTLCYSIDVFREILEASPVEGQSLSQKDKKRRK